MQDVSGHFERPQPLPTGSAKLTLRTKTTCAQLPRRPVSPGAGGSAGLLKSWKVHCILTVRSGKIVCGEDGPTFAVCEEAGWNAKIP